MLLMMKLRSIPCHDMYRDVTTSSIIVIMIMMIIFFLLFVRSNK